MILTTMTKFDEIELSIVRCCNRFGKGVLEIPLRFISSIRFLAVFWFALAVIAIVSHPEISLRFFYAILLVAVMHFGITEGIFKHAAKKFFQRRKRPYLAYPGDIVAVGRKFSDGSFPSSHMASTVAMFFVIVSFYPSMLSVALVFSLIMAFSRIHNGMHYPIDVVAGTLLGMLYGWVAILLVK